MEAEPVEEGPFIRRIAPPGPLKRREPDALNAAPFRRSAVKGIADHRIAEACQVRPYLMGSAGFRPDFEYTVVPRAANQTETGKGSLAPAGIDDGPVLFIPIGKQGQAAGGFGPGNSPVYHRNVLFLTHRFSKGQDKRRWASWSLANTTTPEVSRSMRCTVKTGKLKVRSSRSLEPSQRSPPTAIPEAFFTAIIRASS